jgi:hypothetical protein
MRGLGGLASSGSIIVLTEQITDSDILPFRECLEDFEKVCTVLR